MKLRRSCLSVPGNSIKMIGKSAESDADCLVFDLEDSVPVSEKEKTRKTLTDALKQIDFKQKEMAIRINSLPTEFAHPDLIQAVEARPHAIVIPKVESAQDIIFVDSVLASLEGKHALSEMITIQALIETARGVQSVDEISKASKRLTALIFGIGDYLADIGARVSDLNADVIAMCVYPRVKIVIAAAAAGIDAIDSVYPNFKDDAGLRADAGRGVTMGFKGKWVIHPAQIATVNECFTPSTDEFKRAKRLIEAYEKAKAAGTGAITVDDRMVDEANIRMAQKLCDMARHLGLWDQI